MELSSADLTLHAISSTSFGGYILPNDSSNWSEESTTWDEIIRGGKDGLDAQDLLPTEDSPSIAEFGSVLSGGNVTADIKLEVLKTLCCMDDNTMSLRIVTNSSDGVIYASKEHNSDKGPVMKLEFLLSRNATTSSTSTEEEEESVVNDILDVVTAKPTTSPSSLAPVIPIPASARPLKDEVGELTPIENEPDWIVDEGPVVVVVVEEMSNSSTSVISSSFSMSITAIEEVTEWRNRRHLRASHEKQDRYLQENVVDANQSFQDKEGPAIAEHLTRVYASVLSIAPTSISIVEEDPLVVQNNTATGGVIRESTFRVDAKFDDPEVSNIEPEDAAAVLDQATIYSFIGEEKAKFIEIYKNTGSPIVNEPADYDVTVIKEETLSADGATSPIEGEAPGSSPTTNDSSEWLTPTLISVASIVVVASTAAAGLLWKHRRGSGGSGSTYKRGGDSPRSLDPTAAQTPSPYAFANRFKSKKKFDYEEFDDDEAVENPALSPLTCEIASPAAVSHKAVPQINFPDISFDDSSTGVSDVGVKAPQLETPDMNPSELLLDTTLDSYNVASASGYAGLDDGSNSVEAATPLYDTTGDHSNLSVDSSLLQHENAASGYGAHLFTMDMLRNKDTNLLEMPPPPSDVASDSSHSHQDDVDSLGEPIVRSDTVFTMREKSEQEAVTQTINNELSKVMELLKSPEAETSSVGINVLVDDDESEEVDLLMTDRGRSNSVAEAVKRLETQVAEQKEEEEESSSLVTQRLED